MTWEEARNILYSRVNTYIQYGKDVLGEDSIGPTVASISELLESFILDLEDR